LTTDAAAGGLIFCRRIPYEVAVKRGHVACAALLNPSSAEPLVWPSALKFISELEPNAKSLLEAALMEANRERERRILKGTKNALPSPSHPDDGAHDTAIAEVNSESSSVASCILQTSLLLLSIMASCLGMIQPFREVNSFCFADRYDHQQITE
jgi:hypothetical protein